MRDEVNIPGTYSDGHIMIMLRTIFMYRSIFRLFQTVTWHIVLFAVHVVMLKSPIRLQIYGFRYFYYV